MKILNSILNTGSNSSESSMAEEPDTNDHAIIETGIKVGGLVQHAKSSLSNVIGQVTQVGTDKIGDFLKTQEGKIILTQIAKYILQKYWWAIAGFATFEVIGIYATLKFPFSKRE